MPTVCHVSSAHTYYLSVSMKCYKDGLVQRSRFAKDPMVGNKSLGLTPEFDSRTSRLLTPGLYHLWVQQGMICHETWPVIRAKGRNVKIGPQDHRQRGV